MRLRQGNAVRDLHRSFVLYHDVAATGAFRVA